MALPCEARSDYEILITEEYFPFWNEETKNAWSRGLEAFTELCGCKPDADVEDHDILCHLLVDRGLAVRHPLTGGDGNLFQRLGPEITDRSLCWGSDYFIATAPVARELLIALARERQRGGAL
ncbi:hypothetical protein EG829_12105 [bacterium]|nr:hypothetical protein [bacterium]